MTTARLVFDGRCGVCTRTVEWLRHLDRHGRVAFCATGMDEFTARIKRGTVREMGECEFAARATEAATLLLEDYQAKVTELTLRYYG